MSVRTACTSPDHRRPRSFQTPTMGSAASPSEGKGQTRMKPSKRIAALTAGALALGGVVGIVAATSAQAAGQSAHLYAQINNVALEGNTDAGTQTVNISVSPTSGGANTPISVSIGSPTLAFTNGPAAAATAASEEIDGVIQINSNFYTIRGPEVGCVATNGVLAAAGWTINSTAGAGNVANTPVTVASAGAGCTNGTNVAGTTGSGTFVTGNETGSPITLTSPSVAGTYNINLVGLNLNSIAGGATAGLQDPFDEPFNTDSSCVGTTGCAGTGGLPPTAGSFYNETNPATLPVTPAESQFYISNASGYTGATFQVNAPTATVSSETNLGSSGLFPNASNTNVTLGSGGVPYVRANDVLTINTNSLWNTATYAGVGAGAGFLNSPSQIALSVCPTALTQPFDTSQGCAPGVGFYKEPSPTTAGGVTSPAGQWSFTNGSPTTFSIQMSSAFVGNYNIWVLDCAGIVASTNCVQPIAGGNTNVQTPFPAGLQYVKIPFVGLGTRALSSPASTVSPGGPVAVSGSNWYPNESVSVTGGVAGANYAQTITSTGDYCSNGTGTIYAGTSAAPSFATNTAVNVKGTTGGGGVANGNNQIAKTVTTDQSIIGATSGAPFATGGTYTLTIANSNSTQTTAPIAYNAAAAAINTAVNALSNMTAGATPVTLTASGAATANRTLSFSALTNTVTLNASGLTGSTLTTAQQQQVIKDGPGFNYTDGNITCGANLIGFTGADSGTIQAIGTQQAGDTVTTITTTSTGTFPGTATAAVSNSNDNEFWATGLATYGTTQNYAEGGSFAVSRYTCVAVSNGNHSNFTNGTINTGANAPDGLATPGSCATAQNLSETVTAGTLSQTAYQTGSNPSNTLISFGNTQTGIAAQTQAGVINTVDVTDTRAGTYGWSLSATMPNLVGINPAHQIGAYNLQITPGCVIDPAYTANSASGELAGGVQTFGTGTTPANNVGNTVDLCTKDNTVNAATQSTSGLYDVSGALVLTIPAFQAADTYTSTMTITLT